MAIGCAVAGPAWAEPEPAGIEEAKRLYAEALAHFTAGRCPEAMPLLTRASKLVPSPNSGLLIARCLVVDKKNVEAAARYADVERDALNLVRSGETRYAETAAAAAKEGAALRARLGTLRLRVPPAAGASIEVDGSKIELPPNGETALPHEPGTASVTLVLPSGRRQRSIAIAAGKESVVSLEAEERTPSPPPPPPKREPWPWSVYAAGGASAVGFITFGGFGIASESVYSKLATRCGPTCGPADRADADRGETFQTIANVGLALGIGFAAVTALILLTH